MAQTVEQRLRACGGRWSWCTCFISSRSPHQLRCTTAAPLGPIFAGSHARAASVAGVEVTAIIGGHVAATYLGAAIDKLAGDCPWAATPGCRVRGDRGRGPDLHVRPVPAHGHPDRPGLLHRLVRHRRRRDRWTLQGEVFPTAHARLAGAFAAMIDWIANFAPKEASRSLNDDAAVDGVTGRLRRPVRARHRVHLEACPGPRACRSRTSRALRKVQRPGRSALSGGRRATRCPGRRKTGAPQRRDTGLFVSLTIYRFLSAWGLLPGASLVTGRLTRPR